MKFLKELASSMRGAAWSILLFFFSCVAGDAYDLLLKRSVNEFSLLRGPNWKIIHGWEQGGIRTIEAEALIGDTTFLVTLSERYGDSATDRTVKIQDFIKSWAEGDSVNLMSYRSNGSVSYWSKHHRSDPEDLRFLYGYYTFLYQRGEMTADERKYYEIHRDSLMRLPGRFK